MKSNINITQEHFLDILDELDICHSFDVDSGITEFIIAQDDPYIVFFKFHFAVEENRNMIQAQGFLCEFDLDDTNDFKDAYRFSNHWHEDKTMPKVIVNEEVSLLICNWSWDINSKISDQELKEDIILKFIRCTQLCINEAVETGVYPLVLPSAKAGKKKVSRKKNLLSKKGKNRKGGLWRI